MRSAAAYLSNPASFDWPLIATQHSCCRLSPKQSGWSTLVDITLLLLKRLFFLRHTSPIWPAKFVPMQQNSKSVRREGAETLRGPLTAAVSLWVSIQVSLGNPGPKMAPDGCNAAWTIVHKWFYNFKHYISLLESTGSWCKVLDLELQTGVYQRFVAYLWFVGKLPALKKTLSFKIIFMYTIIKEISILWTWNKKNVFLSWWQHAWWRCYPPTRWSRHRHVFFNGSVHAWLKRWSTPAQQKSGHDAWYQS